MIETALTSFTTFFATIGPVEAAVLFSTLTPKMSRSERAAIAVRATIIASLLLLIFTLLGQPLLDQLGVSIAALQTAGGRDLAAVRARGRRRRSSGSARRGFR
jgi:multiple antibiotic resistance protein